MYLHVFDKPTNDYDGDIRRSLSQRCSYGKVKAPEERVPKLQIKGELKLTLYRCLILCTIIKRTHF